MIFRAFSSVPRSITSPEGNAVNGVYGLIGTLLRQIKDHKPSHVAVAFDLPEVPTYRHELFPQYQGQRGPLGGEHAENFAWQVERAKEVLTQMGLRWLAKPGFEADDVIGTLSVLTTASAIPALIVSSDRDLQQLSTNLVRVLIPGKKPVEIGPDEVKSRLGIPPERIVDWKVLAGDPSDNIPGVQGIGDKSAVALVERFGAWESVYDHLDEVSPRLRTALEAGRSQAELFSEVVRIRCDLDLGVGIEELAIADLELPDRAGTALRNAGLRAADA